MIKIQNNNNPSREQLPAFLVGLAPESLADLSWTDPALGVQDCAWLPEVDVSDPLGPLQRYGAETLTLVGGHVEVRRAVEPMTGSELAQAQAQAREAAKAARSQAVANIKVTTTSGKTFDGDEDSQARMARAIIGLQAANIASMPWTLSDNSRVDCTLQEITEAMVLAGQAQSALWAI